MTHFPYEPEPLNDLPAMEKAILALTEFDNNFPAEKDCVEELYKRHRELGMIKCRYCGSAEIERDYGDRVFRCQNCRKRTWFTAGTFFNRARSTRCRLAIIWLMELGVILSSSKLHELLDISQSNALTIKKKIATVIQAHMEEDASPVHSSFFSLVLCKRSRETPARAHPVAELDTMTIEQDAELSVDKSAESPDCPPEATIESSPLLESLEATRDGALCGREKAVFELLSQTPLHFDVICDRSKIAVGELSATLVMLELNEFVTRLDGDYYVRFVSRSSPVNGRQSPADAEMAEEIAPIVRSFTCFVRAHLHGISRKYLQKYLATYWYHADRVRWQCGSLLRACLAFRPITYDQIVNYVSPAMVTILPCQ